MTDYINNRQITEAYQRMLEATNRDEATKDYSDILDQAEEIYVEALAEAGLCGGSDPYGDAEIAMQEFLMRHIPHRLWDEYGVYDPMEDIKNRAFAEMEYW